MVETQDDNRAGRPKPEPRPNGLWVGFGLVFSKNHLTQNQPNPTWKLIGLGSGRQFDDWFIVSAPKKVPEPSKSPKIAWSIHPDPTQTQNVPKRAWVWAENLAI
jgi:hypothetical protein